MKDNSPLLVLIVANWLGGVASVLLMLGLADGHLSHAVSAGLLLLGCGYIGRVAYHDLRGD